MIGLEKIEIRNAPSSIDIEEIMTSICLSEKSTDLIYSSIQTEEN